MTASSFLSDFESLTGLSFWLFLLIMAATMAANSVISRWRRRRFAGLYRPSNLLLMFVLCAAAVAVAFFKLPHDTGKPMERADHTTPQPQSN